MFALQWKSVISALYALFSLDVLATCFKMQQTGTRFIWALFMLSNRLNLFSIDHFLLHLQLTYIFATPGFSVRFTLFYHAKRNSALDSAECCRHFCLFFVNVKIYIKNTCCIPIEHRHTLFGNYSRLKTQRFVRHSTDDVHHDI